MKLKTILAPTPIAILLIAGTALASMSLSYTSSSQQTLGVTPPPVIFVAGSDSGASSYVTSWSTSTNATSFTVTLKGVPEVTINITNLFDVYNQDALAAHTATMTSSQVVNAMITEYKVKFYTGAGGSPVATLDMLAASPSANLGSIASLASLRAEVVITLASGAGNNNVNVASSLTLAVSG